MNSLANQEIDIRSCYIHVPFCAHKCGYCDFVTTSHNPEMHDRYVDALKRELEIRAEQQIKTKFDTVFIGGGTPTLLQPSAMDKLLELTSNIKSRDAEVTIECNPETVTPSLAKRLVEGGITRVSLGAQSFTKHVLDTLERRAQPEIVVKAFETLRNAGINNLSLDLIWGVPNQSLQEVEYDLEAALALEPDHISAYELEFKPGTKLTRTFGIDGAVKEIGEYADEIYDLVIDKLEDAGWWWYETANFARNEDFRCQHNLAYWHAKPWVGVGVGAVETVFDSNGGAIRRKNNANVPRWLANLESDKEPGSRIEKIDKRTLSLESIMLAVRLDEDILITENDIYDEIINAQAIEKISEYELGSINQLEDEDGVLRGALSIRLNRRGRMLQHTIIDLLLNLSEV